MTKPTAKDSKEQIFAAFNQLIAEKEKIESKIATKEQEAEKEKNKELLEIASTYTIDSIVKGLADLQLDVGKIVNQLTETLTSESDKLEQLQKAIEIEKEHLQQLKQIRIAADALYILNQEHQENLKTIEQKAANEREIVEKDQTEKRKYWQKEQTEYDILQREKLEKLTKKRQEEEADYQYILERTRKIETDEYDSTKRTQEREIQETNVLKNKLWAEREKVLNDQQTVYEENIKKIEVFPSQLEEEVKKAREEAMKEATNEAKFKADLADKEWEGLKQSYELKIQSLSQTIQRQIEQITDISNQLQAAITQAQSLATRAFGNNG
ncbi:MAG TPA: hypothetical protein V6C58_04075 [Allocoleopsis sp.]